MLLVLPIGVDFVASLEKILAERVGHDSQRLRPLEEDMRIEVHRCYQRIVKCIGLFAQNRSRGHDAVAVRAQELQHPVVLGAVGRACLHVDCAELPALVQIDCLGLNDFRVPEQGRSAKQRQGFVSDLLIHPSLAKPRWHVNSDHFAITYS